jgi:hypothetical protein
MHQPAGHPGRSYWSQQSGVQRGCKAPSASFSMQRWASLVHVRLRVSCHVTVIAVGNSISVQNIICQLKISVFANNDAPCSPVANRARGSTSHSPWGNGQGTACKQGQASKNCQSCLHAVMVVSVRLTHTNNDDDSNWSERNLSGEADPCTQLNHSPHHQSAPPPTPLNQLSPAPKPKESR